MLTEAHRKKILEESGVSEEIATKRGYRSITSIDDMPSEFSEAQREHAAKVGAFLVPMFGLKQEIVGYQVRPDVPRFEKMKYESPAKSLLCVDVSPSILPAKLFATSGLWF